HRYSVAAYATLASGNGTPALTGPTCAPVPVLARTPAIAFGELRDGVLSLRWSATGEDGVRGYQVCAGATCAITADSEIVPPRPPGASPPAATITPVGIATAGLASSVSLVSAFGIQSGEYTGARLSVTLSASGTPAPQQAQIDVLLDGVPAARALASTPVISPFQMPVALAPGAPAAVRVSGVGAGSLAPASAAVAIPSSAPRQVAASYDGAKAHISWEPVADPGVSGYLVTVAGATPVVSPTYVAGAGTGEVALAASFPSPFPGAAA